MKILFIGEVDGASAEYMRDSLIELGHTVNLIDNSAVLDINRDDFDVIIISDYPANKIDYNNSDTIISMIKNGARFIMVGGWDSFNGRGTNYYNHRISEILPVELFNEDDRRNAHQGLILIPDPELETDIHLDWNRSPVICGYNSVKVKDNAAALVWAKTVITNGKAISLDDNTIPIVIKNMYGEGAAIACATDLAPHWCGGLVDWGENRVKLKHVEVGNMYIQFIKFLLEA